jgi:hypothetical protein
VLHRSNRFSHKVEQHMKPSWVGFTRAHLRVCAVILAGTALLAAPKHAVAGQPLADETSIITALVTDTAGKALAGVEITVVGTELRGVTDDNGQIYMSGVPARKITLRLRRVGFKETSLDLYLTPGVRTNTHAVLTPAVATAATLEKIVVHSSELVPARYAGTSRFDAFYRRMKDGNGIFLTREFMDARAAERPEDLLRSVSGIRIRYSGSKPDIEFIRCQQVEVYINGFRSHDGFVSYLELNPREIEAMEVYRGVATVPPEFSPHPNDCAAVVVWTRWH